MCDSHRICSSCQVPAVQDTNIRLAIRHAGPVSSRHSWHAVDFKPVYQQAQSALPSANNFYGPQGHILLDRNEIWVPLGISNATSACFTTNCVLSPYFQVPPYSLFKPWHIFHIIYFSCLPHPLTRNGCVNMYKTNGNIRINPKIF